MRFPNVKVKRQLGTMTYYYLPKKDIVIIDPGYDKGDIHIYKRVDSIHSDKLSRILEENLDDDELEVSSNLRVHEIGKDILYEIFEVKR